MGGRSRRKMLELWRVFAGSSRCVRSQILLDRASKTTRTKTGEYCHKSFIENVQVAVIGRKGAPLHSPNLRPRPAWERPGPFVIPGALPNGVERCCSWKCSNCNRAQTSPYGPLAGTSPSTSRHIGHVSTSRSRGISSFAWENLIFGIIKKCFIGAPSMKRIAVGAVREF